jgi:hypothetical protein
LPLLRFAGGGGALLGVRCACTSTGFASGRADGRSECRFAGGRDGFFATFTARDEAAVRAGGADERRVLALCLVDAFA